MGMSIHQQQTLSIDSFFLLLKKLSNLILDYSSLNFSTTVFEDHLWPPKIFSRKKLPDLCSSSKVLSIVLVRTFWAPSPERYCHIPPMSFQSKLKDEVQSVNIILISNQCLQISSRARGHCIVLFSIKWERLKIVLERILCRHTII